MSYLKRLILSLALLSSFAKGEQMVFSEPPANFKPKVIIAACFIQVGDEFLFLHRVPSSSEGNRWGIPGGKVDKGEDVLTGVIREVFEETGYRMNPADVKHVGEVFIRVPEKDFVYHMFELKKLNKKFEVKLNPAEHKGFTWVTLRDSLDYDLIQGEHECIERAYGIRKAPQQHCVAR